MTYTSKSQNREFAKIKQLAETIRQEKKALESYQRDAHRMFGEGFIYRTLVRRPVNAVYRIGKKIPKIGQYFEDKEEEIDPLNRMEHELRGHVEKTESIMVEIQQVADEKRKVKERFETTYENAKQEGWDQTRLFEEVLRSADMTVDPRVGQLANYISESLTDEQKEKEKTRILDHMASKLKIYEETERLLKAVAEEGYEVHKFATLQYDGFMAIKDQVRISRDAALHFPDTQDLSLYSKQYMLGLIEHSASALGVVLDTLDEAYEHLIANEATAEEIARVREKLNEKLRTRMEVRKEVKPKPKVSVPS